jgi:hypothetical protein
MTLGALVIFGASFIWVNATFGLGNSDDVASPEGVIISDQSRGWPWLFEVTIVDERAPFVNQPRRTVRLVALIYDAVIMALLTSGGCWTVCRWCRRGNLRPHFGMKSILAMTATVACIIVACKQPSTYAIHERISSTAVTIVLAAVPLTWYAFWDVCGIAWNRIVENEKRNRESCE